MKNVVVSFLFFWAKLKYRISIEMKRIWRFLDIERMSCRGYRSFSNARELKSAFHAILGVYDSSLLMGISETDRAIILKSADQALRHEFDLLGSGLVVLDPIDWQSDFKTGKKWKKDYYCRLTHIQDADIKVPWELSRCQHLLWLGEAYLITGKKEYAKEIIDEINWWIDDNPLMYTVNWKCAMDVAFRATSWMFALNMISSYEGLDDALAMKISRSLWQHGFFIFNNLEKSIPYSNNHYASDLIGLLYLGELFKTTSKGKKWRRFAINEFYSEVRKQVLYSGVHFERSISYHRLMTELLSYPVYMLIRVGEMIPNDVLSRIDSMYAFISTYTKPNGLAPLIGDNDDGRFLPFIRRDFRDHEYLNDAVSVENRIVTLGHLPLFCSEVKNSHLYADAGFAVSRVGNNYLFINNGGYSKRPDENQSIIGTHTHNDLLSFELAIHGHDIIIDPGSYLYTSSEAERDAFRSTIKHNTIVVDREEQNEFIMPFYVKRNVHVGSIDKNGAGYEGWYNTINGKLTHHRSVVFEDGVLFIKDYLIKEGGNHMAAFFFHFAEDIDVSINERIVEIIDKEGHIFTMLFDTAPKSIEIINDSISPSYGVKIESKTVVASFPFDEMVTINTAICLK